MSHEPFGYRLHTRLPDDKNFRESVAVSGYVEAIRLFMREARKVVEDEK